MQAMTATSLGVVPGCRCFGSPRRDSSSQCAGVKGDYVLRVRTQAFLLVENRIGTCSRHVMINMPATAVHAIYTMSKSSLFHVCEIVMLF